MNWTSSTLSSPTGAELQLFKRVPNAVPKAIVQINHGMAEHAGRYERFALALEGAGYGVYAHDHRGHGKTAAPDAAQGVFAKKDGWQKVLQDVDCVNGMIAKAHPKTPVICFGHSMGSIIALNTVMRNPDNVSAVALWNSGFSTGFLGFVFNAILKTQRMFKGSDVPSGLAKKLTFEKWNNEFAPNRTASDWLSRDEAEVDKYIADEKCGFEVSIGLWLDVLGGIYTGANDLNLKKIRKDMPVHLLAGDHDPCTERGGAVAQLKERMDRCGLSDVSFELLNGVRHESLNEIDREKTMELFIDWLDKRFR